MNIAKGDSSRLAGETGSITTPTCLHLTAMTSPPDTTSKVAKEEAVHVVISDGSFCRYCFEDSSAGDLISPCRCTGSSGFVHPRCLASWRSSDENVRQKCEICHQVYTHVDDSLTPWQSKTKQVNLTNAAPDTLTPCSKVFSCCLVVCLAAGVLLLFYGIAAHVIGSASSTIVVVTGGLICVFVGFSFLFYAFKKFQ